jgi:hypothetical protein
MTNLDYSSLMFLHNKGFDSYGMLDASLFATDRALVLGLTSQKEDDEVVSVSLCCFQF